MTPRWRQVGPKRPQDGPRWAQEGLSWGLTGIGRRLGESRLAPRWPQEAPRWPQDGFEMTPKAKMKRSWLNVPVISHFCNTSYAFCTLLLGVTPQTWIASKRKAPPKDPLIKRSQKLCLVVLVMVSYAYLCLALLSYPSLRLAMRTCT